MQDLKFLILLLYYDRPELVKASLESIANQTYKNYEVLFLDDSEDFEPGFKVYTEALETLAGDFNYQHTGDTTEAKNARGGSLIGKFCNEEMLKSQADIAFWVCDDDQIKPNYLADLNEYYKANPEIMYSYADVTVNDPSVEDWRAKLAAPPNDHFLNHNHNGHNLGNSKDSSQVSWRLQCIKEGRIRMKSPLTAVLDYWLWLDLFNKYGNGVYNGINGVIKSYWKSQLGSRGNTYGAAE